MFSQIGDDIRSSTENEDLREELPRIAQWIGSKDLGAMASKNLFKLAKEDLALMMSIWPELSDRERELQAPMLVERPEDLVEWMTSGAQRFGLGADARRRRQRERDLSWRGFRANGVDTYKNSSGMVAQPALVPSKGWRAVMWASAIGRALNPLAPCVAARQCSSDIRPVGLYILGLMASWAAGMLILLILPIEDIKRAGVSSASSLMLASVLWGAPFLLAWRFFWAFHNRHDRAGYLKMAAVPKPLAMLRSAAAWMEEREDLKAMRDNLGRGGAFFKKWTSARKEESWSGRQEEARREGFERACDFDLALAKFEAFELSRGTIRPVQMAKKTTSRL